MGIPKVIHQMWLDKVVKNNKEPPPKYNRLGYVQTWKKKNPDFKYKLWNMEMVEKLFQHPNLGQWREFWYKMTEHIERCDFARYAIMYMEGGVYVDLDFKCLRPIKPLLEGRELGLVLEPIEHTEPYDEGIDHRLYNGFIMSEPKNNFWTSWMNFIKSRYPQPTVMENTGPVAFARYALYNNITPETKPSYFLNTCDVLPLVAPWRGSKARGNVANVCPTDQLSRSFAVTYWSEGSGWGVEKLCVDNNDHCRRNRDTRFIIIFIIIAIFLIMMIIFATSLYYILQQ
jgi:hypothetical protein